MSAGGEGLPNLANPNHNTREKVAEDIGVAHGTIQKGLDVYRIAYPDEYVHDDLSYPSQQDVADELDTDISTVNRDLQKYKSNNLQDPLHRSEVGEEDDDPDWIR